MPDYRLNPEFYVGREGMQSLGEALSRGADRMTKMGAQQRQIQAEKEAMAQKAMLDQEQLQKNIEVAKQLRSDPNMKNIGSVGISSGGGVNIGYHDPASQQMANQARNDAMQARKDQETRLEATNLQSSFEKLGGQDIRKQTLAINEIDRLKGALNTNNIGQLKASLARLKESGVMTDKDIERYLPSTLRSNVAGIAGFLGYPNAIDPLNKEQLKNLESFTEQKKQDIINRQKGITQEISQRAPQMAPTLSRSGQLQPTLQSLGIGISQPEEAPAQPSPQDLMRKLQEMEARRAKAGVK